MFLLAHRACLIWYPSFLLILTTLFLNYLSMKKLSSLCLLLEHLKNSIMGSTVSKHLHLVWAESQFIQSFVKFSPKLGSDFVKITQILTSIFFLWFLKSNRWRIWLRFSWGFARMLGNNANTKVTFAGFPTGIADPARGHVFLWFELLNKWRKYFVKLDLNALETVGECASESGASSHVRLEGITNVTFKVASSRHFLLTAYNFKWFRKFTLTFNPLWKNCTLWSNLYFLPNNNCVKMSANNMYELEIVK